jgi:predicted RNA-binding Zn-ribbon protein involved in translation (DUF1610 family)
MIGKTKPYKGPEGSQIILALLDDKENLESIRLYFGDVEGELRLIPKGEPYECPDCGNVNKLSECVTSGDIDSCSGCGVEVEIYHFNKGKIIVPKPGRTVIPYDSYLITILNLIEGEDHGE